MKKYKALFIMGNNKNMTSMIVLCISLFACSTSNSACENESYDKNKRLCSSDLFEKHSTTLGGEANSIISDEYVFHEDITEDTKSIKIYYPIFLGLDESIRNEINEAIKEEALSIYKDDTIMSNDSINFNMNYDWYANKDILSVKFTGIGVYTGKPIHYISTINFDLKTGKKSEFADFYAVDQSTIKCLYDAGNRNELDEKKHYGVKQFSDYAEKKNF